MSSNINQSESKVCWSCGEEKSIEEFYFSSRNPTKRRAHCKTCYHERNILRKYQKYNLTAEEFLEIFESQQGVCAICGNPEVLGRTLAIDHDHKTTLVRGLLCGKCNQRLGWFEKFREQYEWYLNNNPSQQRPERHQWLMQLAIDVAARSTCSRSKVGAIVVFDNRIISTGYVGAPTGLPHCTEVGCDIGTHGGCTRTIHAESNAIAMAAKSGIRLDGAEIYCTYSPCSNCSRLLINTGIKHFYYRKAYRDPEGLQILETSGIGISQI